MAKKQKLPFKEFQIKETKYFDALDLLRYNKPKKPSRQQAQKALKTVKTIGPQIGRNATKMWSKLEKKYEISIPSIQKPTKRTTTKKRKKKATSRPRKRKNTKKSLIENIGTDFSPRKEAIIKQKMFDHLYGKGVYNIPIPKEKKKPKKKRTKRKRSTKKTDVSKLVKSEAQVIRNIKLMRKKHRQYDERYDLFKKDPTAKNRKKLEKEEDLLKKYAKKVVTSPIVSIEKGEFDAKTSTALPVKIQVKGKYFKSKHLLIFHPDEIVKHIR